MQVSFKQSPQAARATTKSSDVTRMIYASRAVPMAARNAVVGLIEVADGRSRSALYSGLYGRLERVKNGSTLRSRFSGSRSGKGCDSVECHDLWHNLSRTPYAELSNYSNPNERWQARSRHSRCPPLSLVQPQPQAQLPKIAVLLVSPSLDAPDGS